MNEKEVKHVDGKWFLMEKKEEGRGVWQEKQRDGKDKQGRARGRGDGKKRGMAGGGELGGGGDKKIAELVVERRGRECTYEQIIATLPNV